MALQDTLKQMADLVVQAQTEAAAPAAPVDPATPAAPVAGTFVQADIDAAVTKANAAKDAEFASVLDSLEKSDVASIEVLKQKYATGVAQQPAAPAPAAT